MPKTEESEARTISQGQRRWFFQISVNTADEQTLSKIRILVEQAMFLDPTAAIVERTMMTRLVETDSGEMFTQDEASFNNVN